ncbi:MAG: response regulator [Hyphomicrobium sp.]
MGFLKILLVEDEFLIALDLEQILQDAGHTVCGIATNRDEAIMLARSQTPHLVFLDMNLSDGLTGPDIAREFLRSGGPRAVYLSANASRLPQDFDEVIGVIAKPFAPREVLDAAAYLAEGLLAPPPKLPRPASLRLSVAIAQEWGNFS